MPTDWIITRQDPVLVTGANGFIGAKVVDTLLDYGFEEVYAMARSAPRSDGPVSPDARQVARTKRCVEGNLLYPEDCRRVVERMKVIIHLAASIDKSFSGSFFNTVVGTRNLLMAAVAHGVIRRFVNVSSFAVYSNWKLPRRAVLDERCEVEAVPAERCEPYCYAKTKQDELVKAACQQYDIPYVIVRPGAVFGPRARQYLTPRIGIDTFGIFLHLGGGNRIPVTYVDNCAEAIVLAALVRGVDGEVFNVVDDELPTSRQFLRLFKTNVRGFRSVWIPYPAFYLFCRLWEKYAAWSGGQLMPVFNRRRAVAYWRGNRYSNAKAKRLLGWKPRVPFAEGAQRHFEYFRSSSFLTK